MTIVLLKNFEVFKDASRNYKHFVVAYSGGKDSTAVAILLYEWIKERRPDIRVTVLHNDTLSEISVLEEWARGFIREYATKLSQYVDVDVVITTPQVTENFFWRVFVRGYPAPTFNFRWCVDLLKIKPTKRVLSSLNNAVLVTGLREEESATRAVAVKKRFGACSPGSCIGAFLSTDSDIPKIAPIRFWTEADVWRYLLSQREFDVKPLVDIYGVNLKTLQSTKRFGCWHCTLIRIQPGLYVDKLLYVEALRLIYRAVSDMPEMRLPKNVGYSKLGPLNDKARSILYHLVPIVEEKSGHKFYALDVVNPVGTLRTLFYDMPDEIADAEIRRLDPHSKGRWASIYNLRHGIAQVSDDELKRLETLVQEKDATTTVTPKAKELLFLLRTIRDNSGA